MKTPKWAFLFLVFFCMLSSAFAETEPNNTWETANLIAVGSSTSGSLGLAGDNEDWYKITLPNDGQLKVWGDMDPTLDLSIEIYDINGTSYIGDRYCNTETGIPDSTRHTHLKAGTYYIKTWCAKGYGSYTLKNKFIPTGIPNGNDSEPNDKFEEAVTIVNNGQNTGHLGYFSNGSTDNEDWYKITLPTDGGLKVWGNMDATLDLSIDIYDVDGTSWIGDRYTNTDIGIPDSTRHTHLKAGTYFIKTWNAQGYGSYTLKNKFIPTGIPNGNDNEPNDKYEQAVTIVNNGQNTGHLGYFSNGSTDNDDWYKITLPNDGQLKVWGDMDPTLDLSIEIYDVNGTSYIGDRYCNTETGIPDSTRHTHLKAGTYYIKTWNAQGYGSYTLKNKFTATGIPNGNDNEPNDDYGKALAVLINTQTTGHLGYFSNGSTDYDDWYKIALPFDGGLKVWANIDPTLDIGIEIYDVNGKDFIGDRYTNLGLGLTDSTRHVRLKAGTYFIKTWNAQGYGSYTLKNKFIPTGIPEKNDLEPNNSSQTAQLLQLETASVGHIGFQQNGSTDDEDWYKIVLPAKDNYIISVKPDPTLNVFIDLYNSSSSYITGCTKCGEKGISDTILVKGLDAGTYFIKVTHAYSDAFGSYTLKAEVENPIYSQTPIAFYPFNGNVNDESGNGENGTFINATSVADRFGNIGKAYSFNGNGDYLKLPNIVSRSFTVNFWVKTTQQAISGSYWHNGNGLVDAEVCGYVNDWGTSLIDGGKVAFGIGPDDITIKSLSTINDNKWYMVSATRDFPSGAFKLYINGNLENSGITGLNELNSAEYIGVGNDPCGIGSNTRWFAGSLDDIKIFNRVLSDSELQLLWEEGGYSAVNKSIIDEFVVFPNPSSGVINLRINNNEIPDKLDIFDINGRVCFTSNNWVHDRKIDLSGLRKGLYLIHVTFKDKMIVSKFSLQ